MKLKSVKIQNYRSVMDADFPIDKNLTTLVGANEHGKTNLLRAIELLDFETPIKSSDIRIVKDPITQKSSDTTVTFDFALSDIDITSINSELAKKAAAKQVVVPVAPAPAEPEVSTEESDSETTKAIPVAVKAEPVKKVVEIGKEVSLEVAYDDGETNIYTVVAPADLSDDDAGIVLDFLQKKLESNIFYFDTFEDRLGHRIPKAEIIDRSNDVTNGLLKLAGLTGKEKTLFEDTPIARQLLKNGAEELTKQLKNIWVQGKEDDTQVRLTTVNNGGEFLNVDIEDFNTYGDVSTRSRGFLFFLAFILKFKEYHDGDLEDFIFLIDEPGIFLHPRGQKDLLAYLESLSEFNQMIYTTHSPFMINRLNNFRVRVVSKDKEKGTQVDVKPFVHNWKSLRASLGMMLADSFYYADNNLVVEGPSDRLYVITLLKILNEHDVVKSDLNILSIIDSGGSGNVASMCKIVQSEDRPFVVLVDADKAGADAKNAVVKFEDQSKVKQVADFKADAVTLEDLLPRKHLSQAINEYIQELATDGVCTAPEKAFNAKKGSPVMDQLKKYIEENALGIKEISKLNIARHFEFIVSSVVQDKFDQSDFADTKALIEWVSSALKINLV